MNHEVPNDPMKLGIEGEWQESLTEGQLQEQHVGNKLHALGSAHGHSRRSDNLFPLTTVPS